MMAVTVWLQPVLGLVGAVGGGSGLVVWMWVMSRRRTKQVVSAFRMQEHMHMRMVAPEKHAGKRARTYMHSQRVRRLHHEHQRIGRQAQAELESKTYRPVRIRRRTGT